MHVGMVAFTDLRYDYRIFREARCLVEAGHRVTLISSLFHRGPVPAWDGVVTRGIPIDRRRSLRLSYPAFWRQATRQLAAAAPEVCHAHDLDALLPAMRVARQRCLPLIYDSHELWTEQSSLRGRPHIRAIWMLLERFLIRSVDQTITVSQSIADELQQRYGLAQVCLVRNLPPYQPPVSSHRLRDALRLDPARPVVLYQGGFLPGNGLPELIQAAPGFGDAALVLLGDGPEEDRLRRLVEAHRLGEAVYFHPRVPFAELHACTCSADLGVCLFTGTARSSAYALPNKLFEYLMAGLPVLASDLPEMRRVVLEAEAGLVVNPLDGSGIARAVVEMLADQDRRVRWRQAALAAARQYCWEAEAQRLTALYASL